MKKKVAINSQKSVAPKKNNHKNHKHKYTNKRYDLLVIRVNSQGELRNSKPCNNCIKMMRYYRINRVYYSNSEGQIVCEKVDLMGPSYDTRGSLAVQSLDISGFGSRSRRSSRSSSTSQSDDSGDDSSGSSARD